MERMLKGLNLFTKNVKVGFNLPVLVGLILPVPVTYSNE